MRLVACAMLTTIVCGCLTGSAQAIQGGTVVTSAPTWIVSIQKKVWGGWQSWCTGEVVGVKWVLTAGHCFDANGQYKVVLGRADLDSSQGAEYAVLNKESVVANGYATTGTNDFALLYIGGQLPGTLPMPLSPQPESLYPRSATLYGYGCVAASKKNNCTRESRQLRVTPSGSFGIVAPSSQQSCGTGDTWVCGQTFNGVFIQGGDSGAGWLATVGGGSFVEIAVEHGGPTNTGVDVGSPISGTLANGVKTLDWIRAVTQIPTPHVGDIWRDVASGRAWVLDAQGFRESIPSGGDYQCLVGQGHTVVNMSAFMTETVALKIGASATCLGIAGGTLTTRHADDTTAITGMVFGWDPHPGGGTITTLSVSGPTGWNGGQSVALPGYHPLGIASTRNVWWQYTLPVTGSYLATAQEADGNSATAPMNINASTWIDPPRITTSTIDASGNVSVSWTGSSSSLSYEVRVLPEPWDFTEEAVQVFPGTQRSASFSNLPLTAGAGYVIEVVGFSSDLLTPGTLGSQLNAGTDAAFVVAPVLATSQLTRVAQPVKPDDAPSAGMVPPASTR